MCAILSISQSVTFHASDAPLQRKITTFPNRRRASGLVVKSQFPILGPRVRFPAGASLFFFVTFPPLSPSFNFFSIFLCYLSQAERPAAPGAAIPRTGRKKKKHKQTWNKKLKTLLALRTKIQKLTETFKTFRNLQRNPRTTPSPLIRVRAQRTLKPNHTFFFSFS